jgi:hypothetical protein
MKTLNIFRSRPEAKVEELAREVARGDEVKEVRLYALDPVDYDQLLAEIMASDKVLCWW